jgi:hypothetical protein
LPIDLRAVRGALDPAAGRGQVVLLDIHDGPGKTCHDTADQHARWVEEHWYARRRCDARDDNGERNETDGDG